MTWNWMMKIKYLYSHLTVENLALCATKSLSVFLEIKALKHKKMELSLKLVKNKNRIRKVILHALRVSILAVFAINPALAEDEVYAFGLWGDLPYNDVQALIGVPNLIADMNSQRLAFTVQDGDLKGGSSITNSTTVTTCADGLYTQALGYFNKLKAPAAFTPGDNDWTDCDRPSNGSFNSLERLDHERQVFFKTPFTLGQNRMRQEVQTAPLCLGLDPTGKKIFVPCSENRRWTVGGVTYATLNIQGSCNNLCDTAPDPAEFSARNAANIAWMQETFYVATTKNSAAIMFVSQGNPGWDLTDGTRAPLRDPKTLAEAIPETDGYQEFLSALRDEVIAFRKPVSYAHGDSHYFRVDKPFLDSSGKRLENFTRVETFGDNAANGNNDVNWLKVLVNVRSREVFAYQPQIVPGNRVDHTPLAP
jgi:hypothetical protein